ncbi:MAG: ribosomal RNA small subunit methyltransferase A [Clostridia bacterium]|nr:ribosomal RNA small subunit methyltransferase A [Clostridia bacterium]
MDNSLKILLAKNNVALKKAYGQNFLTDENLLCEIVEKAGITKNDTVLEIGCGAGALTRQLALKAKRVIGYEIDKSLKPVLSETLSGFNNVCVEYKDIMREKLADVEKELGGEYKLVANLPYYITTPIVMNFIENSSLLNGMAIMVQEEVADRFSALPATADYGAITVAINLRGSAKTVLKVPREKFTPVPNVDSAVVKIDLEKDKFAGADLKWVRDIVRAGFSSRRKMLVNNLMNGFKLTRSQAETALNDAGISLTARGETLSAANYVKLSEVVKRVKNG